MAIDLEKVRSAYLNGPPSDDFTHVPSREERIAESEWVLVQLCLEAGKNPETEGLGEHGALIGGPGKPMRALIGNSRPFEHYCAPRLAPTSWFQHENGLRTSGINDPEHCSLDSAIASYMAGTPQESRPTAAQLYDAFWADCPSELERFWLYSVLSCVSVAELRRIIYLEGLPLYAVVGALHQVGVLRHDLTNWLNQFASCPSAN